MARFLFLRFTCLVFSGTLWMTHGLQSDDACPNADLRSQDVNSLLQAFTRHQQPAASLQLSKEGAESNADANAIGYVGYNKASPNPCEWCYNGQEDGTCIVSAIDGLCSNPSDTHLCSDSKDMPTTDCGGIFAANYLEGFAGRDCPSGGFGAINDETVCEQAESEIFIGTSWKDCASEKDCFVDNTDGCYRVCKRQGIGIPQQKLIRQRPLAMTGSWVLKKAGFHCTGNSRTVKAFKPQKLTLLQCQAVVLADPGCSNVMFGLIPYGCSCVLHGSTCNMKNLKYTNDGDVYEWQTTTQQAYKSISANPEQYKLYKLVVTNSKSVAYCPKGDYLPKKKQAAPNGSRGYKFYWEHTGGKAFVGWFWQSQAWWFSGELKSDEKKTKAPKPGKWTKCTFEYEILK